MEICCSIIISFLLNAICMNLASLNGYGFPFCNVLRSVFALNTLMHCPSKCYLTFLQVWINDVFIHCGYFYNASSSPLLLRVARIIS